MEFWRNGLDESNGEWKIYDEIALRGQCLNVFITPYVG